MNIESAQFEASTVRVKALWHPIRTDYTAILGPRGVQLHSSSMDVQIEAPLRSKVACRPAQQKRPEPYLSYLSVSISRIYFKALRIYRI